MQLENYVNFYKMWEDILEEWKEYPTANESNPQNEYFGVTIGYNMDTNEFISFETEQG
ncbi:hypothetical protein LCGC14_3060780 [marine sediment metagenome]|uniref:Uncharacterized protein n=1 Tax=marine sediment metagenome TaxID=412755 RepID=A0A0F8WJH6_9ZZZZ